MARNEIRLYVCEDEKWGLAKRYRHAGEETSAIGAAKLSLVASSCIAAMVAHCFTDPKDGAPCYFNLFYSDKPGVQIPSPPLLGRLSLQRPPLPPAPAKPVEEAKPPPREPAPPPREPARPAERPAAPRREERPAAAAASAVAAPTAAERGAGAADAMPAIAPLYAAARPFDMSGLAAAPVDPSPPAATPSAPASPMLQESRARMLQFLEACLTHSITQKYLAGELDPKNRFGLHLLALGAGQACVAEATDSELPLPDIVEPALAVLGSDAQKARAFALSVADYAVEAKNAAMIEAGQQIMGAFLRDKTVPGEQLNRALQLWNTVQRGEDEVDSGTQDVVIMFTDMVSSVETTQQLGDEGMMKLVDQHNLIIGAVLKTMGGHQVKHTGDGIMAVFPRVGAGVAAAAEIQRQIAEFNAVTQGAPLKVRIGLSAGNPIRKEDDYFGTVVQMAARVCPVASAGEIALPDAVSRMPGCEGFAYSEPIPVPLKGFSEPQLVRKLLWS